MGEQEALIEILKKLWTQYLEMHGLGIGDIPFTGLFYSCFLVCDVV